MKYMSIAVQAESPGQGYYSGQTAQATNDPLSIFFYSGIKKVI